MLLRQTQFGLGEIVKYAIRVDVEDSTSKLGSFIPAINLQLSKKMASVSKALAKV